MLGGMCVSERERVKGLVYTPAHHPIHQPTNNTCREKERKERIDLLNVPYLGVEEPLLGPVLLVVRARDLLRGAVNVGEVKGVEP